MDRVEFLPETPQEITQQWLSGVFDSEINEMSQDVLGEGQGFMGDVLRIHLKSDDANVPRTLVAKLPKKDNRVFGEMLGVYEREIMFFQEFAEHLPIRVPKLYYSEFDRDKGSEKQGEILRSLDHVPLFLNGLISWLGGAVAASKKRRYMLLIEYFEGMQPGDQLVGLDVPACRQVLQSIAPMHKQYWQSDKLDNHFWLLELDIDAHMRQGMYRKQAKRYARVMGDELAPHLQWLQKNGEVVLRRLVAQAPQTLVHCDLRVDNVVFDGDQCAFIDFQLVRRGPAAYDIAYFITSALPPEATEAEVQGLLEDYHRALDVPDYSLSDLRRDYERAVMVVLGSLSSADTVEFGNERGESMMAAWMQRLKARALPIDFTRLLDE